MKRLCISLAIALLLGACHLAFAFFALDQPFLYGSTPPQNVRFDIAIYFGYACRIVDGQVPYRDFTLEYPPLALPFFLLPRLFTSNPFQYEKLFVIGMFAANALSIGLLVYHLGGTLERRALIRRLAWYTLMLFSLCPMAACRFDLLAMAWMFTSACALAANRPLSGGVLAGLGLLLKIAPGLVVLPALAPKRPDRKHFRRRALAGFTAAVGIGALIWLFLGGANAAKMLMHHVDRGIEIESIYAGILMIAARALGAPMAVAQFYRGPELQTPWSSTVGAIAFPLQAIAIGITLWRARRSGSVEPLRYAGATVLAFVVFSKVLSPQYLLWMMPFVACVNGRTGFRARAVLLAASLATTLIFPLTFKSLETLQIWSIVLLNVRNALLLLLWALLTFGRSSVGD